MSNILTTEAQVYLDKSNEERIAYISQDRWIHYPLAEEIIQSLENIKTYEKNKTRVTSILLVGSSNNGKTSLLEEFIRRNPSYDYYSENPEKLTKEFFDTYSATGIPALSILAPSEPSETRLYSNILNKIFAPFNERDSIARKQYLVEYYLDLLNVDMLIIDEIHNILSGSVAKQKQILNAIKNLSNNLKIPIVLSGTKDALRAVSTDSQISSRFRPVYLKKWKMDKGFVSLLATFLKMLPLKKESNILTPNTAMEILDISDGNIGDIVDSGKSAIKMSRYKPSTPIYAFSHKQEVLHALTAYWGVKSVRVIKAGKETKMIHKMLKILEEKELLDYNANYVATVGYPAGVPGSTNTIKILTPKEIEYYLNYK